MNEKRSAAQAERMTALWQLVNGTEAAGTDTTAVLTAGAQALRPHQRFFGTISRLDGNELVIEGTTCPLSGPGSLGTGARVAFAELPPSLVADRMTTHSWPDIAEDPYARSLPLARQQRYRATICTAFSVRRRRYVMTFASHEPLEGTFTVEDVAYVELLANLFATRMQEAWHVDRMSFQLAHDSLTGLRNRTHFRVDARIAHADAAGGTIAVVSLEGFRAINELYGHIIGDALLVEVGAALDACAVDGEFVGRLAGATFGIFLPAVRDPDFAQQRIAAYARVFERSFSTGDREGKNRIPLGATIGVAVASDAGVSIDTLLSRADTAAFTAKRRGGGQTVVFEAGMESADVERARLLTELKLAVERNEFELYVQPHLDLLEQRIAGAEVLVRWNHPVRGLLQPGAFVPFAEQHGFIRSLSLWVLRKTLDLAASRPDDAFRYFFNVSATDLTDLTLVDELRDAAARGARLGAIGVELTETAAMQAVGRTIQTIEALGELGVHVAIDDFGTGYSSLSLLKRLPVDIVKIDRSFVSEVLAGERDAAIAEAVIGFGRNFGFETLGEGVEHADQLAWLAARGCRYAQGYLIAAPMPIADFEHWMADAQRRSSIAASAPVLSSAVRSPGSTPR